MVIGVVVFVYFGKKKETDKTLEKKGGKEKGTKRERER